MILVRIVLFVGVDHMFLQIGRVRTGSGWVTPVPNIHTHFKTKASRLWLVFANIRTRFKVNQVRPSPKRNRLTPTPVLQLQAMMGRVATRVLVCVWA